MRRNLKKIHVERGEIRFSEARGNGGKFSPNAQNLAKGDEIRLNFASNGDRSESRDE